MGLRLFWAIVALFGVSWGAFEHRWNAQYVENARLLKKVGAYQRFLIEALERDRASAYRQTAQCLETLNHAKNRLGLPLVSDALLRPVYRGEVLDYSGEYGGMGGFDE